jgi:hypothetical protein
VKKYWFHLHPNYELVVMEFNSQNSHDVTRIKLYCFPPRLNLFALEEMPDQGTLIDGEGSVQLTSSGEA